MAKEVLGAIVGLDEAKAALVPAARDAPLAAFRGTASHAGRGAAATAAIDLFLTAAGDIDGMVLTLPLVKFLLELDLGALLKAAAILDVVGMTEDVVAGPVK